MSRFVLGNCIDVMARIPDNAIDFILTDPPYLVGFRDRQGRTIAGDKTDEWLQPACNEMYRVLKKDALMVSFYGWNRVDRFMSAWKNAGFSVVGHLVFTKNYTSKAAYVGYRHECAYKGDENMYCTVKEIIREVLDTDVPDSECVFAVVLTRGDVRHIAQDWNLSDDELETVMQRLDDAFEHGADVSVVHDVVRELMEEKHASRQVTVPAVMLEKVMALAGSEMKRLYAVGSENGGDGDAFVREEREAMDVVLQALDGETMS